MSGVVFVITDFIFNLAAAVAVAAPTAASFLSVWHLLPLSRTR
jgi:hypothetical protein